ncbi:MAG: YtxH domain-containing protein [Bacteroidia bacterium]|nr:YtxH domain-containing protein [Bacteroidia bacterium]
MSSNKSKLFLAAAVGALIGAAVTALFTTEKGKKILSDLKDGMDGMKNDFKENMSAFKEESKDSDQFNESKDPQT